MRSKVLRASLVTLFLLPYFLGIFGTGLNFVPNPSLRWIAASAAVIYCILLSVSLVKTARPRAPGTSKTPLTFIRYSLGFPVIAYFVYVCFYMCLPAAYTEAFGSLSQKQYQIERVKTGGPTAVLCAYRLQLRDVVTVLDDSFCVSEEFASRHSPGHSIVLTGKQSRAGFRFHNAR